MAPEGTPIHGDRSAWNTDDFGDEHGKDIEDALYKYHVIPPAGAGDDGKVLAYDHGGTTYEWIAAAAVAQIAARYSQSSAQSIPNVDWTIVNYDTQVYDTDSAVVTGASWAFTAPKTGYYHVEAFLLFATTTTWATTEQGSLAVYKNGGVYCQIARETQFDASNTYMCLHGATTVYLAASDTLDVRVLQSSGGALALYNDATFNWVCITKG